jgi:hypothetical protein
MQRTFYIAGGVLLGALAILILATVTRTGDTPLVGNDLQWFSPYARVAGILGGGLCLAAALLVIGLSAGHWRHPRPAEDPHGQDVIG